MGAIYQNAWKELGEGHRRAEILSTARSPEGIGFSRVSLHEGSEVEFLSHEGHFVSLVAGSAELLGHSEFSILSLEQGTHLFLPTGSPWAIRAKSQCELVVADAASEQVRGARVLVRSNRFLLACATPTQSMRWSFTPQYLSRRAFLYHDKTLLNLEKQPVSWFQTTMFDVEGLPANEEGESVFKMSYNYRTEPNLCFDVEGEARVRMALHPYSSTSQAFGPWHRLDSDTTYHLDENSSQVEMDSKGKPQRNKHEVLIRKGHVSLMCMHSPAPTGAERHSAGEYSSYGALEEVLVSSEYRAYLEQIGPWDEMVDELSWAQACGRNLEECATYSRYLEGAKNQKSLEEQVAGAASNQRRQLLQKWRVP